MGVPGITVSHVEAGGIIYKLEKSQVYSQTCANDHL